MGISFVGTAFSVLVRLGLERHLRERASLMLFVLPVLASAVLAGVSAGLFSTALGAVTGAFLFLPPRFSIRIASPEAAVELGLFIVIGVAVSCIGGRMRREIARNRRAQDELRESAAALRDLNANLEVRVTERTAELEAALERLQQAEATQKRLLASEMAARSDAEHANRMKDEFLATLSHELRTPLTAILGWAQLLRRPLEPERVQRGLAIIERNARLQAQLIADLLDVSRIVQGKLTLDVQAVDVPAIVDAAVDTVQHAAEAKGITLVRRVGRLQGHVRGDASRLQQVVWNLLTNAIKFTPRGGRVEVSVREEGPCAGITVRDTGQGIDPAFLPHVFERFRQAEGGSARHHGGLGLGLAIVKHLVELHGGTVCVESDGLGRGATFRVDLPIGGKPCSTCAPRPWQQEPLRLPEAAPPPLSLDGKLRGVRVLVVEDDEDTRELVRGLLADAGAEVVAAPSAAEALAILAAFRPDVMVSDLGMPGMDGFKLIEEIRDHPPAGNAFLPAVALTAYARPEDRQRALLAGYQAHLPKPVDPSELLANVFGLSRLRGAATS
jgi:signal transduction histidine kinase